MGLCCYGVCFKFDKTVDVGDAEKENVPNEVPET